MNKSQRNRDIIKERLTILLVFFFCFLISSSEYIIEDSQVEVNHEQGTQDDDSDENETFYNAAVDAVVPFAFATVDHAFHLIYEIVGFETVIFTAGSIVSKYPSHFSEILLERIISINAP
ncbi:MAG: hypothetical protein WD426_14585 [Anditalea sp.]